MKQYTSAKIQPAKLSLELRKPKTEDSAILTKAKNIVGEVKKSGIAAVLRYNAQFENNNSMEIRLSEEKMRSAESQITLKLKLAIATAYKNIKKFHKPQIPKGYSVKIMPGVECRMEYRAIERVGLYIPGGTAPLPSTVLMLAIPAALAGCQEISIFTPAPNGLVHPAITYAARVCGIKNIYTCGGAHGIAAAAYGTSQNEKVYKIFGPGNRYVTAAKKIVRQDPQGADIDFPAGPSEVLVIADGDARAEYVAADLLSQAEHGVDSGVILATHSIELAARVEAEIARQIKELPRKPYIAGALKNSTVYITGSVKESIEFSNYFAPEHLIIQCKNAEKYTGSIINAGSVFLGRYTPESAGDYSSGTNHSLPTEGMARTYGGVTVTSFMKSITFQSITREGLQRLAPSITTLADAEGLDAHAMAVRRRLK